MGTVGTSLSEGKDDHEDEQAHDDGAHDDERQIRADVRRDARGLAPLDEVGVLGLRSRPARTGRGAAQAGTAGAGRGCVVVAIGASRRDPIAAGGQRDRASGIAGALATVARRTAARLELVDLFPVGAGDLRGIQSHQARVGAHHVRRVAARGHAGEITLLDGAQDIRADAQLAGGRGQIESFALAGMGKRLAE